MGWRRLTVLRYRVGTISSHPASRPLSFSIAISRVARSAPCPSFTSFAIACFLVAVSTRHSLSSPDLCHSLQHYTDSVVNDRNTNTRTRDGILNNRKGKRRRRRRAHSAQLEFSQTTKHLPTICHRPPTLRRRQDLAVGRRCNDP